MAKMNLTSLDVLTDEVFGKRGTPKRDAMEKRLQEEVSAYLSHKLATSKMKGGG